MLGAIIGDIVGSRFEWHNIKTKQFDFLTHSCFFTDDSVMSLAIAKAKVERQHRTDELRFYKHMRMFSLEDGRKQLAVYQRESNNHIMTCLGMRSPNQVLELYHGVMW